LWTVAFDPSPSAYAGVSKTLAEGLVKRGHQVDILPMSPQSFTDREFPCDPIANIPDKNYKVLSYPYTQVVPEALVYHWATNTKPRYDLVIWVGDLWANAEILNSVMSQAIPIVIHSPIDHAPITALETQVLSQATAVAVPTRWGTAAVYQGLKEGIVSRSKKIPCRYVPHAVDGLVFRGSVSRSRHSGLVFGTVATNKGSRKNLGNLLRAFAGALNETNDRESRLMLHTYPFMDQTNPSGFALDQLVGSLGIRDQVIFPQPLQYLKGVSQNEMAEFYRCLDYFVLPSKTEGFGLPIIEAAATGVPMGVTDCPPMAEISPPNAHLFEVGDKEVQQLIGTAWWWIPKTQSIQNWFMKAMTTVRPRSPDSPGIIHSHNFSPHNTAEKMDLLIESS